MPRNHILCTDPDPQFRKLAEDALRGYSVASAEGLVQAKDRMERKKFHAIVCDMESAHELIPWTADASPETPIIVTGPCQSGTAQLRLGAAWFVGKCGDQERSLREAVDRVIAARRAADEADLLREVFLTGTSDFVPPQGIGDDQPVLITGDAGTRERIARAVHARSARACHAFTVARASDPNIEADLFGGLRARGRLERANGGTAFIDEIELLGGRAAAMLADLFRTGAYQRDGREVVTDVRVIAGAGGLLAPEFESLWTSRIDVPPQPILKVKDLEKRAILETLKATSGNRTHTARQLGLSLRTLQYRLKEYGINSPRSNQGSS